MKSDFAYAIEKFVDDHDFALSDQVHKLSEETGETSSAFLQATGRDAFRGTGRTDDVIDELVQVVTTAYGAAYLAGADLEDFEDRLLDEAHRNLSREVP